MNKEDLILKGLKLLINRNDKIEREDNMRFNSDYFELLYPEKNTKSTIPEQTNNALSEQDAKLGLGEQHG